MSQPTNRTERRLRLVDFPKRHLFTLAGLGILLFAILTPTATDKQRQSTPLAIPLEVQDSELLASSTDPLTPEFNTINWHSETVSPGDSLSLIFQRAGLNDRDLLEFMAGNTASKLLKKIHPGHLLEFHIEDMQLQALRYRQDRLTSQHYQRQDNDFIHKEDIRKPDVHPAFRQATINDSLFLAGKKVGMDANLLMELANIFGWDIDFGLDIRKGDSFSVLYEELFLDGEKIGNGNILAAQFINQKDVFTAVIFGNDDGNPRFYTPEGRSMQKAFLRAPLDFRRISSNFNPRRLHPITKNVRPHRGTDYAASRGTPVWSAGDGKVIKSSYNRASGNHVVIQHGGNIQTKYLHLHKRHVKVGQRVKQKQFIGTVGSTGMSTAPHLHYEFLLGGVHRNPRTILKKLPKASSVDKKYMASFLEQSKRTLAVLENFQRQNLLASTRSPQDNR